MFTVSPYILTVAVVSLVSLPETVAEEVPLNVCAMLHSVDFTHIPFILNFTISSEQGILYQVSLSCMQPHSIPVLYYSEHIQWVPHIILQLWSISGMILTSNITFPVGQITNGTGNSTSGPVECSEVSLDNEVLDWWWQLTVSLDTLQCDQLTILSSSLTILSTTVIDDDGIKCHVLCTKAIIAHSIARQSDFQECT